MPILSSWLELVIYFQTNEPDGEQNAFIVNFSDNSDLWRGFKASLRDFWDRDISRRTADNDVSVSLPTGYGKSLIYLATPVINRLSSLEKSFAISTVPPVKALAEDQVHYLNVKKIFRLQRSVFFANGAAKLLRPCPAAGLLLS